MDVQENNFVSRNRSDAWRLAESEPPSAEEMSLLMAEYKATGDYRVRNAIVGFHLRLIARSARQYANEFVTFDDLMAEGAIALLKAVESFDPAREVPFTAYASAVVAFTHRGAAVRSRSLVVVSAGERRRRSELRKARSLTQMNSPPAPAPYEAFGAVNTSTAIDTLAGVLAKADEATPAGKAEAAEDLRLVLGALASLPAQARRALTLRYGLFGEQPRNTRELRSELGVPLWQIRQLLDNAVSALRAAVTPRDDGGQRAREGEFIGGSAGHTGL